MWAETSSVSSVNLEKKFTTVPEISNFSERVTFLARKRILNTTATAWLVYSVSIGLYLIGTS